MQSVATGGSQNVFRRGLSALALAISKLANSLADTPVYFWVYVGVMLYITRRLTYKSGFGQKKRVIGGRTVLVNSAEEDIAQSVVDIDSLQSTFSDVGGLEEVKLALTEHIIWPFKRPELFTGNTVRSHPKGVLLYGPPGTGKTLLARALAKELNCSFINVNTESIFSKWVGDTERNAAAIFTLARKIAPCVIFVDEVDSLLSMRSSMDATPHTHAKTIFMTHWDGLEQDTSARVLVIGATNRRFTIDDAVRRRMPLQLEVPPPDRASRVKILSIVLEADLANNPHKDGLIEYVSLKTDKYTGSDLTELCKAAALMPVRELQSAGSLVGDLPPLNQHHFDEALKRVKPSI